MGGKSKGGSSHTPVEAKETGRSFQILRILEVISEGEIEGLVDDMKSVYLDKTPLCNADGTFNFKNVSVYANAGTQDQDVLKEFNSVEKEINVSSKILKDKPIIKTVTDTNVNRIRMTLGVERLLKQEDNGDTNPTSVTMTIEILKNNKVVSSRDYTFNGKHSNPYREMFDISAANAPFSIRVSRVEPDSLTNKLQNTCFWSSYTEIIDKQFAYPNTALVGIKIDSEYFSNVPTRNYEIKGLIVKVPSNYNPETHTYTSDFWDGSFKVAWTNNPAWVFYDLVTNTRYGMGKRLQEFNIDKWQLYAIGRYCDELVPDGFGGEEPRMTCNIWITDQRKAYDLINDICSIFRAMPVWNGQALTAIQDRKADPVWTYNNANTIGGFTRQRSARKARHNTIQVEYIDASDFYEKKVESVSDDVSVARFGLNVKKITAFGCTSRGQAYRTGRWILETEKLETETITFTVGQEGVMHLPYDVIEVADSQYAGVNVGGRVLAVNNTQITLDRPIEIDDNSYLSYVSAKGITENVKIISFDKQTNIATVGKNLNGIPELTVWGLSTKRITTGLYRAISIKENDNAEGKTYTITALQHVPEKEEIVTNGTHFDPKPKTIYGNVVDAEIKQNGSSLTLNGKVNGSFNILSSNTIANYTVKLLKDGTLVYIEKGLASPDIKVDDLENGTYEAQILAYNDKNQLLSQYNKTFTIDKPPIVKNILITGLMTAILIEWDYVDEFTDTEIWVSDRDDLNTAKILTKLNARSFTHEVGSEQIRYYWLRHTRGINVGSFNITSGRHGQSNKGVDKALNDLRENLANMQLSDLQGTLEADQLNANSILAKHLGSGSVTTDKLEAGAVTTNKIDTGAVTADKIKVLNLSAVSANMGAITAGSIKIGSRNNLGHGTLFEVKETGGFVLTSRNGLGGVEFSSERNAFVVWRGNAIACVFGKLKGNV
jgi:phage tail protein/putative fels-1 prophage host specificity protein|nr:MAG TPA: tail protein [Caudoviricetes sp.]